jgi:hypothetical protein
MRKLDFESRAQQRADLVDDRVPEGGLLTFSDNPVQLPEPSCPLHQPRCPFHDGKGHRGRQNGS